jgi:hypothetical protein
MGQVSAKLLAIRLPATMLSLSADISTKMEDQQEGGSLKDPNPY